MKEKGECLEFDEGKQRGDARLLPAFVVHEVVGPNGVQFCVRLIPNLAFEEFGFVDEGPVVAEHAFVHSEGRC